MCPCQRGCVCFSVLRRIVLGLASSSNDNGSNTYICNIHLMRLKQEKTIGDLFSTVLLAFLLYCPVRCDEMICLDSYQMEKQNPELPAPGSQYHRKRTRSKGHHIFSIYIFFNGVVLPLGNWGLVLRLCRARFVLVIM